MPTITRMKIDYTFVEPPPTYESLFGKLTQIKNSSDFIWFINLFSTYLDDSGTLSNPKSAFSV